jgi:hypothetical protein
LLVVEQVKDLQNIIDDAPDLDENVTYGGEHIDLDYFYRPQTKRDIADTKHAFAMRDLKKGDKFTRPDFTSFSFDVHTSYQFTDQGAVYSKFTARGCNFSYWIPTATEEYEYRWRWNEIGHDRDNFQSVQALVFRVVEIEQDVWRQS